MIDYRTLSHLMKEAAEYGIKAAMIDTGQMKAYISKSQAGQTHLKNRERNMEGIGARES